MIAMDLNRHPDGDEQMWGNSAGCNCVERANPALFLPNLPGILEAVLTAMTTCAKGSFRLLRLGLFETTTRFDQ